MLWNNCKLLLRIARPCDGQHQCGGVRLPGLHVFPTYAGTCHGLHPPAAARPGRPPAKPPRVGVPTTREGNRSAEEPSSTAVRARFLRQAPQSVTRFQSADGSSHTCFGNQRTKPSLSLANQVKPLFECCHFLIPVLYVSDQCRCSTSLGHGPAS